MQEPCSVEAVVGRPGTNEGEEDALLTERKDGAPGISARHRRVLTDPSLEPLLLDPPLHLLIDPALERGRQNLLRQQHLDGHWCGLLEGDSCLESEYVLLHAFMGRQDELRVAKAAERVRRLQLDDGGWAIYPGGPPEVSASVKAYFVLKLMGDDPAAPHMERARRTILELGGIEATNTYTRIYLALFGQYDWSDCPAVVPEVVLLPDWSPLNINRISSWSRAIFVPLSIVWAHRPVVDIPEGAGIAELNVTSGGARAAEEDASHAGRFWGAFFDWADRALNGAERLGLRPFRKAALEAAESWILDRIHETDGLGAVFPSVLNALLAFKVLGYDDGHEAPRSQWEALEKMTVEHEETVQVQPTLSPVWDTAHVVLALVKAGLEPDHPAVLEGARWLLDREVRREGDWRYGNRSGPVAGWYFQYANEDYPDCDDTAQVLQALQVVRGDEALAARVADARKRAVEWLVSMQNRDGGWGAFDCDCDAEFLTHIRFADHNAMIDPSCADITGRVLETLAEEGVPSDHPAVRAGVVYIRDEQEDDGTWYGRWGCNYLYGTALALRGLRAAGEDMADEACRRAARWIREHQNEDGGWGELPDSYWDPGRKGIGPSTAAQTAWAVLGLLAVGDHTSIAVRRGVLYLLRTQREDGAWDDPHWTGTGFPRVFFLAYHLYDDYFPLRALSRYKATTRHHVAAVGAAHANGVRNGNGNGHGNGNGNGRRNGHGTGRSAPREHTDNPKAV